MSFWRSRPRIPSQVARFQDSLRLACDSALNWLSMTLVFDRLHLYCSTGLPWAKSLHWETQWVLLLWIHTKIGLQSSGLPALTCWSSSHHQRPDWPRKVRRYARCKTRQDKVVSRFFETLTLRPKSLTVMISWKLSLRKTFLALMLPFAS